MPGGSPEAYSQLEGMLVQIAAQTPSGPCVTWVGHGSAGHYVKMVHNGIEYAIMQLISEIYSVLKFGSLSNVEIAEIFEEWNEGELKSFLIEITAVVLRKKDEHSDHSLVDLILDKAKQKGTGMWTSQSAMDLNVPIPLIDTAVTMRFLSARKEERVQASSLYNIEHDSPSYSREKLIQLCKQSMLFGMLLSYGQGLDLLNQASANYKYEINISEVIRIWKGGCIIRSGLLDELQEVYTRNMSLKNILLSDNYVDVFTQTRKSVIELINYAMHHGVPVPCISSALNYFDAYRSAELSSNLIQAQRDYFGAHTYERKDMPGTFHSNWEEK
jgi:6-phosphogluconate dehydrogenase